MNYLPAIPFKGYSGWIVLNRTMEKQQVAFTSSTRYQNDETYFRENISKITSAEDLVADRRLLSVALGSFGLDDDINNKFFITKILSEGTISKDSLANRLVDKRYREFSATFGFGDYSPPLTQSEGFSDVIMSNYKVRKFEDAVGSVDENLRYALTAQRELPKLASQASSVNTKWYEIIGSKPLSRFIQTALGLPDSIAVLDVDRQLKIYKDKATSILGSNNPVDFTSPQKMDDLIKRYLLRATTSGTSAQSSTSSALQILQGQGRSTNFLSLLL